MRILLLSDIHGNLVALETALAHAPAYDQIWCLGDIVGYGPAPNECCEVLREHQALVLLGNHDAAVVGKLSLENFTENARRALQWTLKQLKPENVTWLTGHVPLQQRPADDLTLVHASPRDPLEEYIHHPYVALENMSHFDTSVCLYGHTHVPMLYRLRASERVLSTLHLTEQSQVKLEPQSLLNPGSVGQPRDGDPRASFLLLDLERRVFSHFRVEYDIESVLRAILEAGLPPRLAYRLTEGR